MTWDNSLFDEAFDAVGLRDTVTLLKGAPYPTFQARFEQPQQIMLDDQVHTTNYSIEYTTSAVTAIKCEDKVRNKGVTYTAKQPPTLTGDGYWTIAQLEVG